MNKNSLLILASDKAYALERIATLQREIDALGPEFNDAFTQTSETWHDNAPFEIVRDRQAMLYAEHQGLKGILQSSLPSVPEQKKDTVGVGAINSLPSNHEILDDSLEQSHRYQAPQVVVV